MVKIVLNETPLRGECPFCYEFNERECIYRAIRTLDNTSIEECQCIGGYYDSLTFDFYKCPYCTVHENLQEVKY